MQNGPNQPIRGQFPWKLHSMSTEKPKRNYSQKTIKVIFGLSGNQCAHPKCANPVIEPRTERSDALVVAQICHIYALNVDGPRGKTGLTEKDLNSPENLLLLCPTHHRLVDGQHETYPAATLKQWKQEHEAKMMKHRLSPDLDGVLSDVSSHPVFPTELVDQEIKKATDILRKSRFFIEFDRIEYSLTLARKLTVGELSGGSDRVRSKALGWCIRLLSDEQLERAESYLEEAREIGPCPEIDIAAAFIASRKGDKVAAMQKLAKIDSPISRSASLMVVAYHDSPREAVEWLKTAGIDASDLDADGKRFLLASHFELADWKASRKLVDGLTNEDFHNSPALYRMAAVTHLLTAVPEELRPSILCRPPFEGRYFPLVSDSEGLEARRAARRLFIDGSKVSGKLNCPVEQKAFDEYALWLELRDPEASDAGRQRLESRLSDPVVPLHLVRLGVQFGVASDMDSIIREIERQVALNGQMTADIAIARFVLVFVQQTPRAAAEYIARHRPSLVEYIDDTSMRCLHIEYLAKAGQLEEAKRHLDLFVEEGIPEFQIRQLQGIIAEAQGADPLKRYKEQYNETRSTRDLQILVLELEKRREWESLCDYGETYFEATRALEDAERLAQALYHVKKNKRLLKLLEVNRDLLERSRNLQLLYCWALYMEGELLKANDELERLGEDWDDANYRNLKINLAIYMGDWNSVSAFIANECKEKLKRNAQELIATAQLAIRLDSDLQAKELTFAAVEKGNSDAGILGTAYVIATKAGWVDKEVSQWIQKAAEISGDDGPIQRVSLKELVDRKPDWEQRDSEISRQLSRGDLPIYLAAQVRNTSLGGMMLFSALANLDENDPRRKDAIPAYSGQRQKTPLDTGGQVGIDATALLTLGFLNVLDKALDAFDTIHLPHSTLGWLFDEKQRVTFHQPSRITDAHQIRNLVVSGALEELWPSAVGDSDLAELVGDELAQFIAEATTPGNENEPQRIVVHPAPVYRVSSLMEEEADLTAYEGVLSSCQAIVDKLRQKGQITANEEREARAYFQLNEKPWPNQPNINDGAILYLDDSAVYAFLHLGILGKLKGAGFRSIISLRMISETRKFISYESISDKAGETIERIRSAVNPRIASRKIKVGRRTNVTIRPEERAIFEHPTVGVVNFARNCDAVILDDRCINQHANIDDGDTKSPIFSTLDLIDALATAGLITEVARLEYRTQLRQAGFFFVPVTEDEMAHHLDASPVENGEVIDTAELKAIRENILQVRMSTWLQLPKEEFWLKTLLGVCHRVLVGLWSADADLEKARARSEWILRLMDVRGWAHIAGFEDGVDIVKSNFCESILSLISHEIELPPDVRGEFQRWVEESVLAPLKEQNPEVFRYLVDSYKGHISSVVDKCMTEINTDDDRS